ncbi:ABC-type transport system involved in multi-copper enzyme maturation permease subunit [Anaerotaenia torta]|uniref:ABC transporter permease subunit n=1 Tax=Anaerotaenia torta TaxID=433293 RepID=UPI003D261C3F
MNKLLSAHFSRLIKAKSFWFGIIVMSALIANVILQQTVYEPNSMDVVLFGYAIPIGFLTAVFCSLFLGTEYSDGTLRNKLVVGHTRNAIYLSHLIVCTAAALLMSLAGVITTLIIGLPLLGPIQMDGITILILFLDSIMMIAAFSAIFTQIGMLISNKAITAIVSMICIVSLILLAVIINSRLQEPETFSNYLMLETFDGTTKVTPGAAEPNPLFLRGIKRAVYEFFYDFLPTGQSFQISNRSAEHLWQMPLYSLVITIVTSLSGLFFFRRKDLK